MERILVAVGSTRSPKIKAVTAALECFGALLHPHAEFEVVSIETSSGVGHTPVGRAEIMAGARGRAEALVRVSRERGVSWRYFIGLEGGLEVLYEREDAQKKNLRRWTFLENWAFVTDGQSRNAFGHSGGILLPEDLASQALDQGIELAVAIDTYAGRTGIRDAQGAWGVLTRDLIERQESYRIAVINAFAPFYNSALYSR